ncbi:cell division protein FtsZ [Psychrobacter sp. YP14]|uniref:Cell division protein ZipA n=1 Tax=Psychrobacter raelei TaxID=2565531 RepID=A0AAT9PFJ6_9GAMM|nr:MULTISPECIES: cell division protein ZipA C-terminal FtsZ-binding domain-containing protein [unclassified Psychrobacter]AWT48497.1 cell division protein FtsZ [Psychrobacter sp. YP14]UNK05789.1 cell division protein FtsZ [Psychrobacter sp. PraFG1]
MTTVDYILIIIAVVIMVVGLYMIIRGISARKNKAHAQSIMRDKNGIPIIPRHERKLVEEPEALEAGETVIVPDREHLQPVITDNAPAAEPQPNHLDKPAETEFVPTARTTQSADMMPHTPAASHQFANTTDSPLTNPHLAALDDDGEDDLFSSLASATEKLMPVIETAQESEFLDNSPMLDQHLLAEADQDQNSPLNHAQENINITLVPKNSYDTIDGKTILSIVSQYGLKYGAMNMFHRYENKDGSGILWFSMMGVTQDGIAPFDLNLLPTSRFNGLVLFLSLPHPKATQGFDTMMSVVNLISNDLNTLVLDENNDILTRERRQQLRAQVQEYQAAYQQG